MLYNLFSPLADKSAFFNLFRYETFRCGGAIFSALIICFLIGPGIIRRLRSRYAEGQPIRSDGPESHLLTKKGTPTMGGVMILISVLISTVLWADITNPYVWVVLGVTFAYGLIGFIDDLRKLTRRNSKGLSSKQKMLFQIIIAVAASLIISKLSAPTEATHLALPFFKNALIDLGWFYFAFTAIVIVGASNAVNLTDGLDGLAIVPIMIASACFGFISYLVGRVDFSTYLQIHNVKGAGEIAIYCSALLGAGLGFLWFNAPPAKVFMGDTGSLAFGGSLGVIAVIVKHEIVLAIIGGLFVLEAVSVILQVASFKMTGKRIFRMAPIHHHFEKLGWAEPTVVIRFWIISVVLALIGLSTLKLR